MPEFDGISEYVKSGFRRLRDAEELLQRPTLDPKEQGAGTRHLRGAVYLSGYGVECLLKAYLISRQWHCSRLSEAWDAIRAGGNPIRDICGEAGHDLRYLLSLTDLEARMGSELLQQMSLSARWSSSGRYDPRLVSREDAQARIEATRSLVNWIYAQI